MTNALSTLEAIEQVKAKLIGLTASLDAAERFHRVHRGKAAAQSERFSHEVAQTTPLHEERVAVCQHNRDVFARLSAGLENLEVAAKDATQTPTDLNKQLLEILQDAINTGQWATGLFFQVIDKKLTALHQHLAQRLSVKTTDKGANKHPAVSSMHSSEQGKLILYLSLYQTGGVHLVRWQALLSNITAYSLGRPVYTTPEDVKAFIRDKPTPENDAYVVVSVEQSAVLHQGPQYQDKVGRPLVTLKKGVVHSEDILEFVHIDRHYQFIAGRLLPLENASEE